MPNLDNQAYRIHHGIEGVVVFELAPDMPFYCPHAREESFLTTD